MDMLNEGLGSTAVGQRMLAALAAGDRAAFNASVAAAGLLGNATDTLASSSHSGLSQEALETSPSAAEAEAAETMGEVLRALRLRGVMSASAAFQHFQPGEDGCISAAYLLDEISRFG